MRAVRTGLLVAISVAGLAPALRAVAPPAQQPATGTIDGVVTRLGTNEPIPDVHVSIGVTAPQPQGAPTPSVRDAQPAGDRALSVSSDAAGHFSITAPEGVVVVHAQLEGYFGPAVNGISPPEATTIAIVTARQTTRVQIGLTPGGTINGRVTDATGKALANVPVGVVRKMYRSGVPSLDLVDGKETDDRGAYRVFRLPPGEYLVVALQGHAPTTAAAAPPPLTPVPVTTFYPSAVDAASALPVTIKGGDDIPGLDIQVRSELTRSVSGRVTSMLPRGSEVGAINGAVRQPLAVLALIPRDGTMIPDLVSGNITASADGAFVVRGLLPGSYDLIARLPAPLGWGPQNGPERATNPWAFGRVPVEIGGADVDNVNVVVHQGVDVTGRVTVDGQGVPAAVRVTLQPDDNAALYNNYFGTISNWAPFLAADGSFTFPFMPESHYRFRVGLLQGPTRAPVANAQGQMPPPPVPLPPNAYVADVQLGGRSVYDEGLTVGADPIAGLEVIVKSDGGTIEGTVTGADKKPLVGRTVVLVPERARRGNFALYKATASDEQGEFRLARVPPGAYRLFAWDSVVPGAYESAEFIERYESRGTDVKVAAAGTVRIDLTAIR
jgi:hypothetical protein